MPKGRFKEKFSQPSDVLCSTSSLVYVEAAFPYYVFGIRFQLKKLEMCAYLKAAIFQLVMAFCFSHVKKKISSSPAFHC